MRSSVIATIKDVAQKAGVSTTTVSHILNDTRFVSEKLRAKVYQAIEDLNYQPHGLARSLRKKRTKTVGMIVLDNSKPFFAEITRAIEDACYSHGYNVIICNSDGDVEKEANYVDLLIEKGVDGLAFISAGDDAEVIELLCKMNTPWIIADRELPAMEVDTVIVDNYAGGRQATEYLISLGHEKIACISGPSQLSPSAQRSAGYKDALEAAGLPLNNEFLQMGEFRAESGYQLCQSFLRLPNPPTALFVCNDLMAIGALCAAHEMAIKVPEELSIIGFDDIALAAMTIPRLTTVSQPKQDIGEIATKLLVERIQDKSLPTRKVVMQPKLIIRNSCSRPRSTDFNRVE